MKVKIQFEGDIYEDQIEINQILRASQITCTLCDVKDQIFKLLNLGPLQWPAVEKELQQISEDMHIEGVID